MKSTVTLIGKSIAKIDDTFQFLGPLIECKECHLKNVCFGLEYGKIYKITGIRPKEHKCTLHASAKVVTIEVEEVLPEIALPRRKAVEGSVITYSIKSCPNVTCKYYSLCVPLGMKNNTKLTIANVEEKISCPEGIDLVKVRVKW